jgi:hypothetical protein
METNLSQPAQKISKSATLAGRVLSGIAMLFLTMDVAMKLLRAAPAVKATVELGYPEAAVFEIGVLGLICLLISLVPRTAVLGAVLWTGYLGGAIASHVRVANPLFSHTLFPVYIATMIWGGLWLRDARVRAIWTPKR